MTNKKVSIGKASKPSRRPGGASPAKIQNALYRIADAASAFSVMQDFYARLHGIVGELMYAENFIVQVYDDTKKTVTYPYVVDVSGVLKPVFDPIPVEKIRKGLAMHVLQTGKTLHVSKEESARMIKEKIVQRIGRLDEEDWLGVPLLAEGRAIGVIAVQTPPGGSRYTEEDARVLEFVAQHIATALTRARAIEETRQRNSELQIINSIQEGLAAELDFQSIVDLVGDKLRAVFDTPNFEIRWFDEKNNMLHFLYTYEHGERVSFPPMHPPPGGVFDTLQKTRKPYVLNSVAEIEKLKAFQIPGSDPGTKSVIWVPIISSDRVRGLIGAQNFERENAFGESEIRLMTTIAASLGASLENARLFTETQRLLKETEDRNAELAILNSVGEAMVKTLDVKTVTRIVGDKVRDIFSADQIGILLFEQQTNMIYLTYGYDKANNRYVDGLQIKPIPLGKGLTSKVIVSRQPLLLSTREEQDVHGHYLPPELKGKIKTSESWLGVPIMVEENVLGVVMVEDYRPHMYNENHLRLLQTLSSNMGVAIQNARLFDETQQRNAELAIINSVQEGLASKLEIQSIYDLVGNKVREIFRADITYICAYDARDQSVYSYYYVDKEYRDEPRPLPFGQGLYTLVIQSRQSLLVNEAQAIQLGMVVFPTPGNIKGTMGTYLGVPLLLGDEVKGVVSVQADRENAYNDSDVRLLQTLANSMSVALENARLWEQEKLYRKALQRELEIGREIQAGFLPETLPRVEGWEIAASLMSAREVAGDFYDAFELPDGTIGLVIADVCDKGVGAALFMTLFRSLIRAAANLDSFEQTEQANAPHSSSERLQRAVSLTNNYIAETHGDSGMFATIFFGILDPRDGKLIYINGGHESPLIVHDGNLRASLRKTGPAVGARPNSRFAILETQLQKGDTFFAFTDGVPDCQNPRGDFFGRERLQEILHGNHSADETVDAIQAELRQYIAGANQFDDITLMAVRRV